MMQHNAMIETSGIAWTDDGELEVLTFALGGELFAIDALLIREIVDLLPTTAVPGANPLVADVFNFRGRVIPLADMRPAFRMERTPPTSDTRIVVVELMVDDGAELIGLRTDKVDEVTVLHAADCEEPPVIGMRWPREHIRGFVRRDNDVIALPDIRSLFNALANQPAIH